MGYLSKILSAVGVASTMPFASPQNSAPTRSIGGLEGTIRICVKTGVKLCQTNHTHNLWDGELYNDSGEKIILNNDGTPIASGRWSYRGLENYANTCFKEGVKECYTNHTHYLLNNELFFVNPDGALVKTPHPSEQPKAEASSNKKLLKEGLKGNVAICEKRPGVQRCEINGSHYLLDDALHIIDPKDPTKARLIPDAPAKPPFSSNKKLLKEGLKGNVVICEKPPGVQRCEINGSHYLLDDKLHIIDPEDPTKARLIPDAPAKPPFGYQPVEVGKFLTCFTSVAAGAVAFIYLVAHNMEQNANPYNNQVLVQLAYVTAAAATGSQPNPSNLPKKILTNPNPNFITPLSPPKNLSVLSSPPLDRV